MPRAQSDVWKHFTVAKKDGKEVYLCKYCSQQYVKNATKQQSHLKKCRKFPSNLKITKATQQFLVKPKVSTASCPSASAAASTSTATSPCPSQSATAGDECESISTGAASTSTATQRFYFDKIDEATQQKADECLARAIYATGSPLMLTSNVYWQRFINIIRPAYSLPTRYALSTHLMDAEYVRVQGKVNDTIGATDCVAVISDGWSNIRGEGIINYIVSTPQPVFFKSTDTKDQRHTSEYIADELKKVITELGSDKVFAVVTDNAANMKAAWNKVEEAFPHITPLGCAAHGLSLLLGDIMDLKTMQTLYKKGKKVVKYVKRRQVVSATFTSKQSKKKKSTSLKLPSQTRWGAVVIMYNSLVDGKESLQELAIMDSLDIDANIRKILLDNDIFWTRIVNSLKMLKPIADAITEIEGDQAILSDVQRILFELTQTVKDVLPETPLQRSEEQAVLRFLAERRDFCLRPIHAAAYMLDPKYCDKPTLSDEQIDAAYAVITTMARHLHLDQGKVMASLAKFRAKSGLWKGEGVWSSAEHITAATWWQGLCASEAISPIASVILQIPPTSAASERNWSLFANTHTKLRNRLTNESGEIGCNTF